MKKEFKRFIKFVSLAQVASDSGKGYISTKSINGAKAIQEEYGLKDTYIQQAIDMAQFLPNVRVGIEYIDDVSDSLNCRRIILFDIRGYGQMSFHAFARYDRYVQYADKVVWNQILGGSLKTVKKLNKKFNLPYYKHK